MILLVGLTAGGLFSLLLYLLLFLLVFYAFYYAVNNLAPEPMRRILNVILVLLFLVVLIYFILGLVGSGPPTRL